MNFLRSLARNLGLFFRHDIAALLGAVESRTAARADGYEKVTDERFTEVRALAADLEARTDGRFSEVDERLVAAEVAAAERFVAMGQQFDESALEVRRLIDELSGELGRRMDERLEANDRQIDERMGVIDRRVDARMESIEVSNDRRFEEMSRGLGERANGYEAAIDRRFDERSASLEAHLSRQFSDHSRAVDVRLDDRQVGTDHRIDNRFSAIEKRIDERFEMHERRTDLSLEHNRVDIVDRTDLLLQALEQRLDRQRRELRGLREALGAISGRVADQTTRGEGVESAEPERKLTLESPAAEPVEERPIEEQSPGEQIESFRHLAGKHGALVASGAIPRDPSLYQQILDWKKVAGEGIDQFTRDEKEIVDYILGFSGNPDEMAYIRQHLRRFIATMQRIPPPQKTTDRLLELGSLLHIAPAIRRFCGYQTVIGADFRESAERVIEETIVRADGGERVTIPLHNFNAEADPFPFPDKHFRTVLCCELIEHLQRDPMHMLWEINRVLEDAGYLLLTTPNIASARSIEGVLIGCTPYLMSQYNMETPIDQHHREYAPFEIGIALAAAGFRVLQLDTEDVWLRSNPAILRLLREVNLPTNLRGDNIFALATKVGPPVERHPQELYIG